MKSLGLNSLLDKYRGHVGYRDSVVWHVAHDRFMDQGVGVQGSSLGF